MVAPANSPSFDVPPMPLDMADVVRWDETRRRKRMLTGRWGPDGEARMLAHFGPVRRWVMGKKSLAKNSFRKLCHELAFNYHEAPNARHAERGALDDLFGRTGLLTAAGMWPMMRRVQVQLIGFRQMFMRPDWSRELGRAVVRPVDPDWVCARSFDSAPNIPVEIDELRWRTLTDGRSLWTWDRLSVADPKAPHLRVVEAKVTGRPGEDVTRLALGATFEGDAYPYRWTQGARAGTPFLPYSMYHAMRKAALWDAFEGIEVVEGSLDVATAYTFLQHVIFRASWPQRYGLGVQVAGAAPVNTANGAQIAVPSDPTSMINLEVGNLPQGIQPQIGTWGAGADPEMLARTVAILERAVSDFDGIDSSHIVRDASQPWSAAALGLTMAGKRGAQARYTPELHPSDLGTIEMFACICNLEGATAEPLPESDYLLTYRSLPLSAEELAGQRSHSGGLMAQGRMSLIDAHRADHPGMTEAEARADLKRIQEENEEFGVRPGTEPSAVQVVTPPKPVEGEAAPAAVVPGEAAAVADTALNGAQAAALLGVLEKVSAGQLAPAAAKRALRVMNPAADPNELDAMVDESAAFTPKPAQGFPVPAPQV